MTLPIFMTCILCGGLCFCLIFLYLGQKQHQKWDVHISEAKKQLEDVGLIYNHSYRLINKKNGIVKYIRVYDLRYNPDKKNVFAHAYCVSKNGEIGEWYDVYLYLLDVNKNYEIEDCGEWNPKK